MQNWESAPVVSSGGWQDAPVVDAAAGQQPPRDRTQGMIPTDDPGSNGFVTQSQFDDERTRLSAIGETRRTGAANLQQQALQFGANPMQYLATNTVAPAIAGTLSRDVQPVTDRAGQLVTQGASFGYGDEISGGARAAMTPVRNAIYGSDERAGDAYRQQTDVNRTALRESRDAAPVTSGALEMVGGAAMLPLTPGAGFVGNAQTRLGLGARSSLVGAGYGGIVGAGESEGGLANRAIGAAGGAAVGGLMGIAAPFAIEATARTATSLTRVGTRAYRNIKAGRPMTGDQSQAWRRIANRMRAHGIDDAQIMARWDRAEQIGTTDLLVLDLLGDEGGEIARGGVVRNNPAAVEGMRNLRIRQAGLQGRVQRDLRLALGSDGSGTEFLQNSQALLDAKKASGPLYDRFREMPGIRTEALSDRGFADAPAFQRALRGALDEAANELDGGDLALLRRAVRGGENDLAHLVPGAEVAPAVLDRISRRLGADASTARRTGNDDLARQLGGLRREFVAFVDDRYPGIYAAARRAYAGPARQQDAMDAGLDVFRGDDIALPEGLAARVARMAPDELVAFRAGVARGVVNQMRAGPNSLVQTPGGAVPTGGEPANLVSRFWRAGNRQEVLRAAFGDEAAFERFARRMNEEWDSAARFNRANAQRSGSSSASNINAAQENSEMADNAVGAFGDVAGATQGNIFSAFSAIRRLIAMGNVPNPAVETEIQRIIFATPESVRPQLLAEVARMRASREGGTAAQGASRRLSAPATAVAVEGGQ
jgi:hypothetical protein